MEIQQNQPLSKHTTFRIGGPADFFAAVSSPEELKEALAYARDRDLEILVLGHGSNVLAADEGFRGLVIHNQIMGLSVDDSGAVAVGAGEDWDGVVSAAIAKNLAGIECLSGVPGSGGGSVVQNIGAYGQTLGDVVTEVTAIEAATGREKIFLPAACEFAYRTSWFKQHLNKFVLTSFKMRLNPGGPATLAYGQVVEHFRGRPEPSLAELREFIIATRASKGYLIMPGYERYNTAGSFFKNPVVTRSQFERLKPVLGEPGTSRYWELPDGSVKLAAAFLLQEAGFGKGYQEGNVGISPKHSLSLANLGGGTAREIKQLAEKIKQAVGEKFGVKLEEEILYV